MLFGGIGAVRAGGDGLLVAPAGQLPDERLGHVLDGRVAADGVAVDRGVADGELALVAGGQDEVALRVGQRHQRRAAHAGLQVLLRQARQVQGALVGVDHRRDRRPCGCARRCVRPGRRRRRRSARTSRRSASRRRRHALRAEGVAGDGGDEGGVDAAAQAEQHRPEPVLLDVVAQGEDEGAVHLGERVEAGGHGPGRGMRVRGIDVDDEQRGSNCGARASTVPSGETTRESPSKTSSSWPPTRFT